MISALLLAPTIMFVGSNSIHQDLSVHQTSWVECLFGAILILMAQLFVSNNLLGKYHGPAKTLLSVLSGCLIGFAISVAILVN